MGLMSSRDVDIKDVFSHELAPVPTSMFEDSGDIRVRIKIHPEAEAASRAIVSNPANS